MELPEEKWSERLRKIKPKVERILYKGNCDLLLDKAPKLAVVGSRRMTDYGARVIDKWMPSLVEKGVTIVSGFMYGVDQAAHKACLENGGKTIAVLGWGIDRKVVDEDAVLYQKMIELDSLIVSEYEGEQEAELWMFPQRNRIVAGVADAVLVVEGAEKSGSLITARLAGKFGVPLLAVPGSVFSRVSSGTNNLIKEGKAVAVGSAQEVLAAMGIAKGQLAMKFDSKLPSNPVLAALDSGEKSVDELVRILKMPVSEVMDLIFHLQLDDLIFEKAGKYFLAD